MGRLKANKQLGIQYNVCMRVLDEDGNIVQEHIGHNTATNSMLFGIASHLVSNFTYSERENLHGNHSMLTNYVPKYMSLGTMGLINQDQDSNGLPAGIGVKIPDISGDTSYDELVEAMNQNKEVMDEAKALLDAESCCTCCQICDRCDSCSQYMKELLEAYLAAKDAYEEAVQAVLGYAEEIRFKDYMQTRPGYGADGYDGNCNNGRDYFGLGFPYSCYDNTAQYLIGDIATRNGIVYECIADTGMPSGVFNQSNWRKLDSYVDEYGSHDVPKPDVAVNWELISIDFPRQDISYREIVPEYEAELPKTIDVVFSAMISTGALSKFREPGRDYIFITEAGLWSKKRWTLGGENGLLAGYRIMPPNEKNWDMSDPENRNLLKRQILKVKRNQVVQIIWKIQIGSIDQFSSIEDIRKQFYNL